MEHIQHALTALQGLWIGDCFGSHFEFEHVDWFRPQRAFASRQLPEGPWRYTDDTQMALSIYETLQTHDTILSDELAASFTRYFDISRGYGPGAEQLLLDIQAGGQWDQLAPAMFDGMGSYGNGSAMRVAPVGAYFADDLPAVVENSRRASIVTHTHPHAIAGAIAVAVAAAIFCNLTKTQLSNDQTVWDQIISLTPEGPVHTGLVHAASLSVTSATPGDSIAAAQALGCGWDVSAVDTVPFALWCAITFRESPEEALWHAIRSGGDTDTIGAIVGGIIACYSGIDAFPKAWISNCEPLPSWAFED